MKHIEAIEVIDLKHSEKTGGCGECQTSCGVANQQCEKAKK